jgi:hypothetical protein
MLTLLGRCERRRGAGRCAAAAAAGGRASWGSRVQEVVTGGVGGTWSTATTERRLRREQRVGSAAGGGGLEPCPPGRERDEEGRGTRSSDVPGKTAEGRRWELLCPAFSVRESVPHGRMLLWARPNNRIYNYRNVFSG